jgi:hypothetical protein
MRPFHVLKIGVGIIVVLTAALCLCAQEPAPPSKEARALDTAQGLPPRLSPTDYQAQTKAGDVIIAAEFMRHSVPTAKQTLSTEDFVAVEVGLYGPAGTHVQISLEDFSLRLNGKKNTLPSRPYGMVLSSIKDPEWEPPEAAPSKSSSKTSIGGDSSKPDANSPPPIVHVPIELQRSWNQHTQKATLPLGDRVLPQAGLLFFQFRGKPEKLDSVELIYNGSAGKATLALRP